VCDWSRPGIEQQELPVTKQTETIMMTIAVETEVTTDRED
jgi:hypothetical protein